MSRVTVILFSCGLATGVSGSTAVPRASQLTEMSGAAPIAPMTMFDVQAQPTPPARPPVRTPPAPPTPPQAPQVPTPPVLPTPSAAPVPLNPPPPPPAPRKNIQLEFTITDQTGTGEPDKKTVSMIVADSTWGRVRTSAMTRPPNVGRPIPVSLNVDARPAIVGNDSVQMELTIEYKPVTLAPPGGVQEEPTQLNQSLTVMLQNGRSMVVSQAADPVIDRKILVEAKVTVLK
jgi:hypothetical protein